MLLTETRASRLRPPRATMVRTAAAAGALGPGLARAPGRRWPPRLQRLRYPRRVVGTVLLSAARSGSAAATGRRVASGATHRRRRSALAVTPMAGLRLATRRWRKTGPATRPVLLGTAALPHRLGPSAMRPQATTSRLPQPYVAAPRGLRGGTAAATRTEVAIATGTGATGTAGSGTATVRIGRHTLAGGTGRGASG